VATVVTSAIQVSHKPTEGLNHSNKILDQDLAGHDWYRFVLSFPPHLVRHYLEDFGATPGQTLLDPFSGTGTTLLEGKKLGLNVIGFEANPICHFASNTKIDWNIDIENLEKSSIHRQSIGNSFLPIECYQIYPKSNTNF
jgi:hypothetical protein